MGPFDFLNDIMYKKKNILDEETEKDYQPFLINKGLSYYKDCIFQANYMNERPFLSKRMQNDFLINIVRSYKRPFVKWIKPEINDDLEYVKLYFGFSDTKAMEALRILTKEDLEFIKNKTDKGGVKK